MNWCIFVFHPDVSVIYFWFSAIRFGRLRENILKRVMIYRNRPIQFRTHRPVKLPVSDMMSPENRVKKPR